MGEGHCHFRKGGRGKPHGMWHLSRQAGQKPCEFWGKDTRSRAQKGHMLKEVEQAGRCDRHRRGQRRDKEPESAAQRDISRPLAFPSKLNVVIRGL